jgi:uncharacterized membrane protein
MLTKARIAGHPIHPMLIAFPVALYVATVVALFIFVGNRDVFWYNVALNANVAGVIMAAVAAVPGLIDLVTLPRDMRAARATGIRHAGLNVIALLLFTASAISLYRDAGALEVTAPLILGILGLVSTTIAGWLGFTMVQVHHLGVRTAADVEGDVHVPTHGLRIPVRRGLTDRSLRH